MARFYDIHQDELEALLKFINEDDAPLPSPEITTKFQNAYFAFQGKILKQLQKQQKENFRLEKRVNRLEEKETENIQQGVFKELGLDSVEVAYALLHHLKKIDEYRLTKGKIICVLYGMYASWLAGKKERLFIEHPVASEWGPQFWRVYKKLDLSVTDTQTIWQSFAEKNPGVAAFVVNSANKYAGYSEADLKNILVKSMPYKNATADKNNGKWNKEINDSDIYYWKTEKN